MHRYLLLAIHVYMYKFKYEGVRNVSVDNLYDIGVAMYQTINCMNRSRPLKSIFEKLITHNQNNSFA